MHPSEAASWTRSASPAELRTVRDEAALAIGQWGVRMAEPNELHDVACWALGGWFSRYGAMTAAAEVAAELAIITILWPEEPRHVLRPSWE